MKDTTNILLMVLILMMAAFVFDRNIKPVYADGNSGSIIFSNDTEQNVFYIVDTDNKLILNYKFLAGKGKGKGLLLRAARQYDIDLGVKGGYSSMSQHGDSYEITKKRIEIQNKPKK